MKPAIRILLVAVTVLSAGLLAAPGPASAHPMGNFSINQYTALAVGKASLAVHYVVDMAEIPAFQELGTIRPDRSTDLTDKERDAYTRAKSAELQKGLKVQLDGKPLALNLDNTTLSFPSGNGGLPTLRLEMDLSASLAGVAQGSLSYSDENFPERIGWKEVITTSDEGVALIKSSVPGTDLSQGLSKYNPDLLNSAPNVTSATLTFAGTPNEAAPVGLTGSQVAPPADFGVGDLAWVQEQTRAITSVLSQKDIPVGAMLVALLLAFAAGAAHALSPGHGKAVVAAYMVGSKGTPLHAIILGATITFSHTVGVFLLGFVVLALADYILPETLYPWMKFTSGMMLAVLGITLFVQRFRAWKRSSAPQEAHDHEYAHAHSLDHSHDDIHEHSQEHGHEHGHDPQHDHTHDHTHDHNHSVPHKHGLFSKPHTHLPADGQQVTLGGLVALGITGGIIPCPSALIVLLFAVQLGKVALGLLLILAFSLGLAVVISAIGLAMVYSRGLLNRARVNSRLLLRLPMFSALAVCCLGLFLAYGAFSVR